MEHFKNSYDCYVITRSNVLQLIVLQSVFKTHVYKKCCSKSNRLQLLSRLVSLPTNTQPSFCPCQANAESDRRQSSNSARSPEKVKLDPASPPRHALNCTQGALPDRRATTCPGRCRDAGRHPVAPAHVRVPRCGLALRSRSVRLRSGPEINFKWAENDALKKARGTFVERRRLR